MVEESGKLSLQGTDDNYVWDLYVLLRQTNDSIYRSRGKDMARYGLSPAQAGALNVIHSLGEDATPLEVSRWMFREPHSISILLTRMESKGLIKKSPFPNSKKMIKISLTKKGYKAYENSLEMESIRNIFSVLSKTKQKQLYTLLEELRSSALKSLSFDETAAILRLKLAQSNTKATERVVRRKLKNT